VTVGTTPSTGTSARPRPGLGVAFAFLVAGLALGFMGRATLIEGTDLAAVWPAAGVGVVWLLVRQARPLSLDTALLGGAMITSALVSGFPWWLALSLPTTHLLQTIVIVELMRRALPELWGCGGTEAIDSPRRMTRYLACVGTGVLVSTVVGVSWWRLAGHDADFSLALLWFGRNACGVLVVATALLLLLQYLDQSRPRRKQWAGSGLEFVAACATSALLYGLVFLGDVHALLFLLLGVVIWFGVRFGTLTNALHTVVVASVAVAATLAGTGPFAHDGAVENVLLVQLFVLASAVMGLALSTGLDERTSLNAELRQTSQEMTDQAQLLNAVVNSMAEGLAVVDDAGRWLLRNPAATRVGGLAGELQALLSSGSGAGDPLASALAGSTVRDRELVVSGPPGAGRILAVSAAPLPRDSDTGRARALLIFRDATVEHARRVDLTAFAEVVAHDLRNPLAAVESWTEMMAAELEDGAVERELLEEYIDRVGSGARRMTALIEDLLYRATQDAALQLRRVDVATLAEEVAADHGATDQVKVGDVPDVRADAALVRQVLDNLLGNALKFVAPGEEPRITVTGRRTESGTVAVAVADQGVGLPPGADERVFEEHHRAHPSYDGRGLGLAICRRVVERHGGSITARNNPAGRGAVFELTLPSAD
jgi:signal transduction histidine kinase